MNDLALASKMIHLKYGYRVMNPLCSHYYVVVPKSNTVASSVIYQHSHVDLDDGPCHEKEVSATTAIYGDGGRSTNTSVQQNNSSKPSIKGQQTTPRLLPTSDIDLTSCEDDDNIHLTYSQHDCNQFSQPEVNLYQNQQSQELEIEVIFEGEKALLS